MPNRQWKWNHSPPSCRGIVSINRRTINSLVHKQAVSTNTTLIDEAVSTAAEPHGVIAGTTVGGSTGCKAGLHEGIVTAVSIESANGNDTGSTHKICTISTFNSGLDQISDLKVSAPSTTFNPGEEIHRL